jgi:hypothetical protein
VPVILEGWQAALRETASRFREASDRYAWEADREEAPDGDAMREFAQGWAARAGRLEECLRALDLLPTLPDPEKEALGRMLDHVVAWVAPEGKTAGLLDELLVLEEGNREAIAGALGADAGGRHVDAGTRSALEDAAAFSNRVSARLVELRDADGAD